MSAEENQTICLDDDVEEVNQNDMETSAPVEEQNGDAETPMDDSSAVDGEKGDEEKKDDDEEKKEEEEEEDFTVLNLRRPYPNLLTIHKLKLEDIKVVVSELSDYWDDTCLNIKYVKAKTGVRKGFMRMKFPSQKAADVVFEKLQPMEVNGKAFVYEPPTEGNKKDYSLYVNNIPQGVTVKEVQALFPQARNVVIPLNEEDQNQGYAIVECHSLQEAETIMAESKELKLKDNTLSIDLISHNSKDEDGNNKNKKHQNNQQNKKGRFSNQNNRRNQQMNKKGGKRQQQMQQMQPRKQRWSPDRRQQGRKPGQYMQKGRMDGGGRRQLMDGVGGGGGSGQWNQQGGQNVTAALSQTSELLKGLTNLLGHQLMNPNQMGGQGDGQYGNQSWGQGMDQGGNYGGGYQSNNSGGGGGSGNRGYNNDNMNYGNYSGGGGNWGNSYRGNY